MKIICLQENLKNILNVTQNIIGRNLTLPILNNVLLETEGGRLKVSSTNLEVGINAWASGKIEKSGAITCPAKLLASFVNNLPNNKIELETKNNVLTVKCENYRAELKGLPAEDFPIIPKIKDSMIAELPVAILRQALSQVVGSAALSESRPEISGVLFSFGKNDLRLAATDSFRLAEKHIKNISNPNSMVQSIIVPQRTAQELIRIFGDSEGTIKICLGENQVLFDGGDVQLISRLIDGQYPDYKQIIPKDFATQILISREEMVNVIRVAGLFSSKVNDVKFLIQKNKFEVVSADLDLGENKSQLSPEIKGKDVAVSFNYRYLLEGLANMSSKQIFLGLNSDSAAAVLKPEGDDSYTYLIMPIKNN